MQPEAFIEDMNALQKDLDRLPPPIADALCAMFVLVETQNTVIKVLLGVIEKLKG